MTAHALTLAPRILWEERSGDLWTGKVSGPLGEWSFDIHVMPLRNGAGWVARVLGDLAIEIPVQETAAVARAAAQRWLDRRALSGMSTPALACLIDILSSYAEGNPDHFLNALHVARDELYARHEAMKHRAGGLRNG